MRFGAIAFLVGILLLQALPELPTRIWIWALPAVLLALAWLPRLRLPAWIAAGFLWALLLAPLPNQLPAPLEGVDLQVEGWIASIPDHEWRSTRFEFTVDRAMRDDQSIPLTDKRLRLSWWDDGKGDKETAIPPKLRVGDRWNFTVRLKRPHGLLNPGGFDYERWLYAQGIVATGSIRSHPPPQRLAEAERYLPTLLDKTDLAVWPGRS